MLRHLSRRKRLAYCYVTTNRSSRLTGQSIAAQRRATSHEESPDLLRQTFLGSAEYRASNSSTESWRSESWRYGLIALIGGLVLLGLTSIAFAGPMSQDDQAKQEEEKKMETATFGGGCFWCTEAIFEEMKGVESVVSGYAGGELPRPTYQQVCSGRTGHAEVVQIKYDPELVSFDQLLEVFWKTHDPTTLNRQGADIGTQYRSVIFYENDSQKETAEKYKKQLNEVGAYDNPVVTEISPLTKFYPAEDYHQDYYANNRGQSYCRAVISPKMKKFRIIFKEQLKDK